jgi:hypothetical protein
MRRAMLWVLVLGLVSVSATAQQRRGNQGNQREENNRQNPRAAQREEAKPALKNAPSEREILRAQDRVKHYMSDRQIRADYKDGRILFTPADLGGLSDEQMASGFVLGYVETDREKTDSGITADPGGKLRTYVVYCRKEGRNWEVWFAHKGNAIAKSPLVEGNQDNVHPPVFQNSKRSIWYWRVKFDV